MALEIKLQQVSKHFGEFSALRQISESIREGDRISILGHNGAGKSSLLSLVATLSRPSEGQVHYYLNGVELLAKPKIRRLLSYLSHEPMLYPDLSARENLRFVAGMYHQALDESELDSLLERVGMAQVGTRLFRSCSRGMQQRLAIARTLLPQPRLLLLDEPFSGLDQEGINRLKKVFDDDRLSWLLVTHDLQLGFELANRFWILNRGKLVHSLSKSDVRFEDYLSLSQSASLAGVAR